MKSLLIIASIFFSFSSFASDVDGKVFYILKSGDMAERSVTISVPARGEGEVVLSGEKFSWSTTDFWTEKVNRETLFYAAFKTNFQEFKSTIVLKGTYLNSTNKILYYGSMYKKKGHGEVTKDIDGYTYSGGFNFSYDR